MGRGDPVALISTAGADALGDLSHSHILRSQARSGASALSGAVLANVADSLPPLLWS